MSQDRIALDASGVWSACWGGKIANYSGNPGIFARPLGATATGLPPGAFVIRISELKRGKIDHAINLITVRTRTHCFSWPASRDDGNTTGRDIPCEGQRFRLNPHFDTSRLYSPVAPNDRPRVWPETARCAGDLHLRPPDGAGYRLDAVVVGYQFGYQGEIARWNLPTRERRIGHSLLDVRSLNDREVLLDLLQHPPRTY